MRYDSREIIRNSNSLYQERIRKSGKNAIRQYATAPLRYPTEEERGELLIETYTWKIGDRFYKLADQFYGNSRLWWVIAHFNMTPTEAYVAEGSQLYIPLPLERILEYYGL